MLIIALFSVVIVSVSFMSFLFHYILFRENLRIPSRTFLHCLPYASCRYTSGSRKRLFVDSFFLFAMVDKVRFLFLLLIDYTANIYRIMASHIMSLKWYGRFFYLKQDITNP